MDRKQTSQLSVGVILVGIGIAILSRQMEMPWAWDLGRLWPVVFFIIAAGHLATTEGRLLLARATWFLFLGSIFLLHTYRVLPLNRSWPLFIVAGGVALLMEQLACGLGRGRAKGRH